MDPDWSIHTKPLTQVIKKIFKRDTASLTNSCGSLCYKTLGLKGQNKKVQLRLVTEKEIETAATER
jgi:hypothetical protein